ncbi:MAG: hypothetical protein JWQ50_6482 [Caballeronia mineralivorans]|nr:hypothetical protein [Caballeronia mineralivorans]
MAVFVLDRQGRPLMPCTEKRARFQADSVESEGAAA